MADPLLLRLPRAPQQHATWLVLGAGTELSPESGPLELAASRAAGRQVLVLVPGTEVLLTDAQLPPARSGAKLRQLVPYALEEQLAEDIEELHFAIGRRSGTRTPVAVVARRKMDEWLALLKASGIEPAALYADSELLPANPSQAVALLEEDSVTVRPPSGGVMMLPVDALGEVLESASGTDANARGLILYTGSQQWQRYSAQMEALRERFEDIQVQLLPAGPLVLFARQLPTASATDLLQGPYAPRSAVASGWRSWRVAAVLLAALVALHLLGQGVELVTLEQRNGRLDAAIDQVFHAAMPGTEDTEEARRRMQQRLKQLRAGQAGGGFLRGLGALAAARGSAPGTRLEAVTFTSGVFDLKLLAPSVEALNQLSQALERRGWQARLTSGTPRGSSFEGSIRMSRGS
jgi:general secretion pathway protein L